MTMASTNAVVTSERYTTSSMTAMTAKVMMVTWAAPALPTSN
ncbi:Uncharacterised protein [Mycobacteroides abscessus subsp. abscessus]|nr:Uncharacterised protein [Mycobacteroides abscessus subsp. abscessus]